MNKILMIFTIFSFVTCLNAQGVCVIDEVKASSIKGSVISGDENYKVKNAVIKVFKGKTQKKLIKELKSDSDGNFEIIGLSSGKYNMSVSYPRTVSLFIPLIIDDKENKKNVGVKLGYLIGVPCGGGEVKLIE